MISLAKLKLYEHYNGDIDGIQRTKDKLGLEMEKSGEWMLVDNTLQRWTLERNGLASEQFRNETASILASQFEKEAAAYFRQMNV